MVQSSVLLNVMSNAPIGCQAPDRQTLLDYADGFISAGHHNAPFLRIVLSCGNVREYHNRDDVPVRSIRCNCGEVDYEHWFIQYTKENENGS